MLISYNFIINSTKPDPNQKITTDLKTPRNLITKHLVEHLSFTDEKTDQKGKAKPIPESRALGASTPVLVSRRPVGLFCARQGHANRHRQKPVTKSSALVPPDNGILFSAKSNELSSHEKTRRNHKCEYYKVKKANESCCMISTI